MKRLIEKIDDYLNEKSGVETIIGNSLMNDPDMYGFLYQQNKKTGIHVSAHTEDDILSFIVHEKNGKIETERTNKDVNVGRELHFHRFTYDPSGFKKGKDMVYAMAWFNKKPVWEASIKNYGTPKEKVFIGKMK